MRSSEVENKPLIIVIPFLLGEQLGLNYNTMTFLLSIQYSENLVSADKLSR